MFILLEVEYEYSGSHTTIMGVFNNRDDAEKACKYLESKYLELKNNKKAYMDRGYSVEELTEFACFEDFLIARMEDEFQKKAEEMKDVAKWQAEVSEWKAKYEAKVKEVKNLEATINSINARLFCDE